MHAQLRRQREHVAAAASDLGIAIEPTLTTVQARPDGRVAVVVTMSADATRTEHDELLARSALHVALSDSFPGADVHVLARPCTPAPPRPSRVAPPGAWPVPSASEWVRRQATCVHEWACQAAVTMAQSACERVITTLPWRDADGMRARVPLLVERTLTHMVKGAYDPLVGAGNVDALLPPIDGVMVAYDVQAVLAEVTGALGRAPVSQLELVETAYALVRSQAAKKEATRRLCDVLFDTSRDIFFP